jgi:hypothetical protein
MSTEARSEKWITFGTPTVASQRARWFPTLVFSEALLLVRGQAATVGHPFSGNNWSGGSTVRTTVMSPIAAALRLL